MNHNNHHEYRITCRMQAEPAALERICQVVRVRGFRVRQMSADARDGELTIGLTVSGERPIGMLHTQLEKLHCVEAVTSGAAMELAQCSA